MAEADTQQQKTKTPLKKWPRTAKGGGQKACGVEGCKRPYRAKGYCFFHFKKWRQGELPHTRYKTCSKTECRARAGYGKAGLCDKHHAETYKKGEAAPAAGA